MVLYFNTALSPNIGACHAFAPPPKSGNHKIGVLLLSPMYLFLLDDMIKAGGLQLRKQRVCSQLKTTRLKSETVYCHFYYSSLHHENLQSKTIHCTAGKPCSVNAACPFAFVIFCHTHIIGVLKSYYSSILIYKTQKVC